MQKSIKSFLVAILIACFLLAPAQPAHAQISFSAQMNKQFSPLSMAPGDVSRLSVNIFNPNPFALTNASWTDNLPAGLTLASPVNVSNSCGGTVTATAGGTSFSLSGGTVPAQVGTTRGSCTVSVNVTATAEDNYINIIPSGSLSASGGGTSITNGDPASATLNVSENQPPSVAKSFSPTTIFAGATSRLTIVITNFDPSTTLTQASLTDDLPANVFLANPVDPTLTGCGGSATVTAVPGGTSVTLNNGTITPGSTCTIEVDVTSDQQGSYLNQIPANALDTQQGLTNPTGDSARLNVQELGVTKRFSPPSFSAGGTTTLIITLQNPLSTPYTGVNLTDTLPVPLEAVQVAGNTCGGTVSIVPPTAVSLTGGTIPAGTPTSVGTCTISVDVTAPAGTPSGTLTNTIPANTVVTDQETGNLRPSNADVTVTGTDVSGTKSFSPSSIAVGGNSRLRIDIFAPSDTNLTNFSLTDNLPAGVIVSNSTPPAVTGCGPTPPLVFNPLPGNTSISLTGGLIAAGERCRIDVYVTGTVVGTHENIIPPANISNAENRVPTGDISSTLDVTGLSNLTISIVKGFDPLTVFGGSASTMSIELINPGTVPLTGITFTDNMPAGMILANPVNFNVGTCGGSLAGTPGANSFSFSGGSLPALGRCTLTLSATMTVNGNLTNTIPIGAVTTTNGASNARAAEASLTNLPGASVSKFFSPNPVAAGTHSLLTITIQNTGNIALTGMGLSDSLPAGLAIGGASTPSPVNDCGGTLTAFPGTQLIELTNGSLGANSSCTIVVSIIGTTAGDYENTIPAGALRSSANATNNLPAQDTLKITGTVVDPDDDDDTRGGGGGGGRRRSNQTAIAQMPLTGFAPARTTELEAAYHPAYETTGLTLEIPVLNVNTNIVGVEYRKGNWDVSWLQDQVGWLNGTAYPTWEGNSLLTGHVVGADGKPGIFANLKSLGVGEYIFLYNAGYRYTYKVVSTELVAPEAEAVMGHEDEAVLTLLTCDSYDEQTGKYLRRVAVKAILVDTR